MLFFVLIILAGGGSVWLPCVYNSCFEMIRSTLISLAFSGENMLTLLFFCICFEGLNIHFIHHCLQEHFSSLATYHHSKTEDGVSQRFLCCICFSYLLYLICTSLCISFVSVLYFLFIITQEPKVGCPITFCVVHWGEHLWISGG